MVMLFFHFGTAEASSVVLVHIFLFIGKFKQKYGASLLDYQGNPCYTIFGSGSTKQQYSLT